MKYLALLLSMIVGYFVAELVFRLFLEPLALGPRPIVAAVNAAVFIPMFGALGAKILKLKLD